MTDPAHAITDIATLLSLYGTPSEAALIKVAPSLTPEYRRWIMASRFCVLTTVGAGGTDSSPRGDDGPVVQERDDRTFLLPDWRGNNRLDSLRNIVTDGRVSLMFMVPGSANVIRVNGRAILSADPALINRFDRDGVLPRTVIVVTIAEVYSQCARALIRARLWTAGDESKGLPTAGEILAGIKAGFDSKSYDADWPARAAVTMW
jgi:PPOX class probable FMN-dependent enzyme